MANCGWLTTNPLICMGWYAFTFVDSKGINMTIQSQWQPIRLWIPSLHHRLWASTISIPVILMSSAHHANEILNWNTQYFMCGSEKYPLKHCKYGKLRRKCSSTLDSLQKDYMPSTLLSDSIENNIYNIINILSAYYYDFWSCDTEDWCNDANSALPSQKYITFQCNQL